MTATEPADYGIVFDGGSLGNPGRGYGSFRLRVGDGPWLEPVRLEFGSWVTNNEAEYRALIAGLRRLLEVCDEPGAASVHVLSDSQLVVNQMKGTWKVKAANLRPLRDAARQLAGRFAGVSYAWHSRDHSLELLGH
jgi:ribonuclease HI